MRDNRVFLMLAKTFKGLEQVLAQELIELGANDVLIERRAVSFRGDKALMYRANLCLRTAIRVLVPVISFRAKDTDGLYEQLKRIDWSRYMTADTTFAIDATVYSEDFRNSRFVTYRVKDAIVDYWSTKAGKRPNVQVTNPDLLLNVHISDKQITVSLDSSGESLHKRGYRVANTEAPISEVLAAGMLLLAGWRGQSDFYDPMCGSGTLPIEAALIARNIAPGIFRKEFAFEKWPDFDADLWSDIYNDDSQEREFYHKIYGSDASFYAIQQATKNVKAAGVTRDVELRQVRMEELRGGEGLVIINPPYGERLASNKDMEELYGKIGSALKHQFTGATAWIISSNEAAMKCIGLKPSRKMRLLNGELDCQFNKYELFQGKRNERMNEPIYIADYNYPLPDERIAKYPLAERDTSKLLVYRDGKVSEDRFYNVGEYIAPHSLLVYNNTKVIQARLEFHKQSGARIEVFCLEPGASPRRNGESGLRQEGYIDPYIQALTATTGCTWKCMVGNAKKWHSESLEFRVESLETTLRVYKEAQMGNTYAVRFEWDGENVSFAEILDAVGELPIPPYLNRKTEESDKTTYQTVYSRIKGSVAAPTAGLHFTERVLSDIRSRGIETEELTLHVGAGTFLPVKTADANEHVMHTEIIAVPKKAIEHIIQNLGHIVAVGTTSMRTLESLYFIGCHPENPSVGQFEPYEPSGNSRTLSVREALQAIVDYLEATGQETLHAQTQIMIKPGYRFRVVDQLITNFHQPQSTLLLLVSAFVGGDWKTIYDYALSHDFRFLSYGDSSILTRPNN